MSDRATEPSNQAPSPDHGQPRMPCLRGTTKPSIPVIGINLETEGPSRLEQAMRLPEARIVLFLPPAYRLFPRVGSSLARWLKEFPNLGRKAIG